MKKYYILIACIVVAYGLGRYQAPEKVRIETKTVVKTVVEEKIRVKTIIKELPTGEKTTTIVYQNDKTSDQKVAHTTQKVVTNKKSQYSVALGRGVDSIYLSVDRRLIGNLFMGAYGVGDSSNATAGLYLRYSF